MSRIRDVAIGAALLAGSTVVFLVGLVLGGPLFLVFCALVAAFVAPAGLKLIRYPSTRDVSVGEFTTDARAWKRGWTNRGMLVSFSGIDGSGKTTTADATVRKLDDLGVDAVRRWGRWRPLLSYPLMGALFVLLRWRRKDYHRSRLLRRVWGYVLLADLSVYSLRHVYPHLLLGRVVCVDRFLIDTVVEMRYDGLYNERAERLLRRVLPTPDACVYLDVPPEVARERKGDTEEMLDRLGRDEDVTTYLADRRALYHEAAPEFDAVEISTTGPLEETTERVSETVLDAFFDF